MLPGICHNSGAAGNVITAPPSISYQSGIVALGVVGSSSFTNNIGTAAANRYVAIAFGIHSKTNELVPSASKPQVISSLTVAGVSCTKIVDAGVTTSDDINAFMYITNTPIASGQTATVAYTLANQPGETGTKRSAVTAIVYAVYGIASNTPYHTTSIAHSSSNSSNYSSTINIPSNGIIIASCNTKAPYADTVAWTGANKDIDYYWGPSSSWNASTAHNSEQQAATGAAISVTSPTASQGAMVAVTFA